MLNLAALRRMKMTETTVLNMLSVFVGMDAETFCERWFALDQLAPEQREQAKQERGYRAKCVRLLSTVLKKPQNTVDKWGSKFERMPTDYQTTLTYADALRIQLKAAPADLLHLLLEQQPSNEN